MTSAHLYLIGFLAIATITVRVSGLVAGQRIRRSKHSWVLKELPGLILVSLVAVSLANESVVGWISAVAALAATYLTKNVVMAMLFGVLVFNGVGVFIG